MLHSTELTVQVVSPSFRVTDLDYAKYIALFTSDYLKILDVDGLEVLFPYDCIYPEQYCYMYELKKCLDATGHCVLEMPSGTGKTVSLLSLIVAYMQEHPAQLEKFIYCSRTIAEISKVVEELRTLYKCYEQHNGKPLAMICVALSARKNLCIHPEVSKCRNGKVVDGKCSTLTSSFIRAKRVYDPDIPCCDYFENFYKDGLESVLPYGVYSLEDMKQYGRTKGWCPYFVARHALFRAKIAVYSYHYLLDPKIAELISKDLPKKTVVVFDEAHNIDNVCIESMSITLNKKLLEECECNLITLRESVSHIKEVNVSQLEHEYQMLVEGLKEANRQRETDQILMNPGERRMNSNTKSDDNSHPVEAISCLNQL
ncbi:unnamed protein product [Soboliphyme baturini]|uniref:Helicase ATP-binding domain-containing protein n=1 Tax=Soboliphyme baturini TaxID=241478 RepID=A0A183IFL3_9BILA|nr:unnamed protein product [Soboliphyme baturini]